MRWQNLILVLFSAAMLGACAGGPRTLQPASGLSIVADANALPAPDRSDLVAVDRPALVGPLDTILVEVVNIPDFSREIQVDASGRIAMPLVGTIDARGKTAEELAQTIEGALRAKHVRDPQVIVNIKSSVSQVATVDGQVVEPGLYPVTNQMTLSRAIASAKGLTEYAREDFVVILRTVKGQRMAALYNIGAIRRGAYADPPIYANDEIVVGDSPQRRWFRDFVSLSPLLAAPIIALVQRL